MFVIILFLFVIIIILCYHIYIYKKGDGLMKGPIKKSNLADHDSIALAAAKIAHEIKNPLTLISSTLQLLEIQHPIVKQSVHWNSLYDELDFISELLNDFNVLCSTNQFEFTTLDIVRLIKDSCHKFEPLVLTNEIDFHVITPKHSLYIYGDFIRIKEAICNLVKNAIEAVESKVGQVLISIEQNDEWINIYIEDNGNGIYEDQLAEIFNPFVTFKPNGTGLGLPITKSIIETHDGNIHIESTPKIGTKVIVSLPIIHVK